MKLKVNRKNVTVFEGAEVRHAVSPTNRKDEGKSIGITTPDLIKNYLEHQGKINYQGRRCLKENK